MMIIVRRHLPLIRLMSMMVVVVVGVAARTCAVMKAMIALS